MHARLAQSKQTGAEDIGPVLVRCLMKDFYRAVRADPVLGPVFIKAIGNGDWSAHIEKVARFWLAALRIEGSYKGREFMPAHLRHDHIKPEHANIWLRLFDRSLERHCTVEQARTFRKIASAMMENLMIAINRRDESRNSLPQRNSGLQARP